MPYLSQLVTSTGLDKELMQLVRHQTEMEKLRTLLQQWVGNHPDLAQKIKFQGQPGFNNAKFNFKDNTVTTGLPDPAYLAHELGHAENMADSKLYQKFLSAVRGLQTLNQMGAIPAMLGLHAFAGDAKRRDIVNLLSGVSAALAGPILNEEASASANAVIGSPDKAQTLKRLAPAFGAHALENLLPVLLYQVDRRL